MIQLNGVSLRFGARTLFQNVTTSIPVGDKIGLVGRNGTGKSTFLKLLFGEFRPSSGQLDIPGSYTLGYLRQTVDFDDALTPREVCHTAFTTVQSIEEDLEDIQAQLESSTDPEEQMKLSEKLSGLIELLQVTGSANVDEEVELVLKGMGFQPWQFDQPVSELSGGWKMRVELARLLLYKPDLLLLDEPTNHLDIESILWFEEYLRAYAGTVIVVSHDQHVLNNATTRTIEIAFGRLRDFPYAYARSMQIKAELDENLLAAHTNQQRQIAHKERLINKFKAKAGKAKFAKSLQSELKRMELVEIEEGSEKTMRLRFKEGERVGRVVYEADALSKSYGDHQVIEGLSTTIERGEKIAFVGQNGQGKTTFAKILTGELDHTGGIMRFGHNIQLGYYAQNQTELLDSKLTVLKTLEIHAPQETEGQLRSILGSLLFEGDDVTKKVSVLSGGERARLSLACMVVDASNVLVLDEPTNHLDIASKEILKESLKYFKGTMVIVSHDMEFLSGLTEHTLEFRNGRITKHLVGIDQFLEQRKIESLRDLERKAPEVGAQRVGKQVAARPQQNVEKALKRIEQRIEKLESQKRKLSNKLAEPGFYSSSGHQDELAKFNKIQQELAEAGREWEKLVDKIG